MTLPEAVRRMTRCPRRTLASPSRGRLEPGCFADIVVFDPATISGQRDVSKQPHQYAVGVRDVIVNGVAALRDGAHTGQFPGRALYGAGRRAS